ncbi:hypothetical protein [Streptomyces lacrimifluminis]|nr:hypothetical protein [Streptomyces lacrimifluminis]
MPALTYTSATPAPATGRLMATPLALLAPARRTNTLDGPIAPEKDGSR